MSNKLKSNVIVKNFINLSMMKLDTKFTHVTRKLF